MALGEYLLPTFLTLPHISAVLWDHYHDSSLLSMKIITADVSLFVILTGITTVLQLREPLRYLPKDLLGRSPISTLSPFNWRRYLGTRCIGIFPVLWLSLLVYAPFWYLQNNVTQPPPPPKHDVVWTLFPYSVRVSERILGGVRYAVCVRHVDMVPSNLRSDGAEPRYILRELNPECPNHLRCFASTLRLRDEQGYRLV